MDLRVVAALGEFRVAGIQRRLKDLCQGEVAGELMTKFPDPLGERGCLMTGDRKREVIQPCLVGRQGLQLARTEQPSKNRQEPVEPEQLAAETQRR